VPIEPATDEEKKPEARPRAESSDNPVKDLYLGTAEKTQQESAYVAHSLQKPYNPDDLYQRTGDYTIYEDMEVDDQVSIALQLKRDLVIGSGWTIVVENESDEKYADGIYCDLEEDPEVPLDELMEEIIDVAYTKGFSLSEKIFKQKDDGTLSLRNIKTRYPNSWLIHTDKHGNIERYQQHGGSGDIDVDPKSLIHYINNPRHQNPYGNSDLRRAYEAWFVKRHLIRFYSIFLEKAAGPIPVAKYQSGVPADKVLEVFNAIKNFQSKTAMTIPKDFEIEFLQASGSGEAYTKGIDLFNMFIGRALVIPDLLGFQGQATGGGSLSLGQGQISVFYKHIMRRRRTLEWLINKHIVMPLCVWNYGLLEQYPKFKLNPISDEKSLDYAQKYLELVKGKIYKPTLSEINHFKDLIKFPLSDEAEIEWIEAGSAGGFQPGQSPFLDQENDDGDDENNEDRDDDKPEGQGPEDEEKSTEVEFVELGHFKAYKNTDGDFHKRVDFKALEATLTSDQKTISSEAKTIVRDIVEDLLDQIKKKNILGGNIDRMDKVKLKYLKKLQQMLTRNFRQSYLDQKAIARKELFKQNFNQPLPTDKFLEFLEKETYQYVGDWEYTITKRTRNELIAAIKDGRPLSSVITVLDDELNSLSEVSLERYSRTKLTEVMNRARLEEFEDSKVVAGYQYSAIMDDRTTDICSGLHGKFFKAGSEPVPPTHFNCRSTLIPITIFEEFTPDTKVGSKDIDKFIEDNLGEGFSRK